jgi:hypothetical protein
MDLTTFENTDSVPDFTPASDTMDPSFGVRLALHLGVPLTDRLEFIATSGVYVSFYDKKYAVDGGFEEEVLIAPWLVQPWIRAGLSVSLFLLP